MGAIGTGDVSVVLDLMIHDIDIILNFIGSEVDHMHASGAAVVPDHCDIANARIEFKTGCVANITAIRMSTKNQRKIRTFQENGYIAIDFSTCEIAHIAQTNAPQDAIIPGTEIRKFCYLEGDALAEEQHSFVGAIGACPEPVVTGHMGYQALSVALDVMDKIDKSTFCFGGL